MKMRKEFLDLVLSTLEELMGKAETASEKMLMFKLLFTVKNYLKK